MSTVHQTQEERRLTAITQKLEIDTRRKKDENAQLAEQLRCVCAIVKQCDASAVTSQRELTTIKDELGRAKSENARLRSRVTRLSSVGGGVHKDGTSGYRRSGLETTDGERSDAGGMHYWSTGKSLRTSELRERDGPLSPHEEKLDAEGTEAVAVALAARLEKDDRTAREALSTYETKKLIREINKLLYPPEPSVLSAYYPLEPSDQSAHYTRDIRELFRKMDEDAARSTQSPTIPGASRPLYSRVSSRHALTPQAQGVTRRVEMVAISRYRLPMNATCTRNTGIHCEIDRKAVNLTAVQFTDTSATVVFKAASGGTASLSSLLSDRSNPLPLVRVLFDQEKYTHGEAKYDFLNDRLMVHLT